MVPDRTSPPLPAPRWARILEQDRDISRGKGERPDVRETCHRTRAEVAHEVDGLYRTERF